MSRLKPLDAIASVGCSAIPAGGQLLAWASAP